VSGHNGRDFMVLYSFSQSDHEVSGVRSVFRVEAGAKFKSFDDQPSFMCSIEAGHNSPAHYRSWVYFFALLA
jgi:hypothetical protein